MGGSPTLSELTQAALLKPSWDLVDLGSRFQKNDCLRILGSRVWSFGWFRARGVGFGFVLYRGPLLTAGFWFCV